MASKKGSILISCATSLALGLIKPHVKLDHQPSEGNRNVIYSCADKIKRNDESQLNVHVLSRKPKLKNSNAEAPIVCNEYKKCQAGKGDMWPKKSQMDMQQC